MVLSAIHGRRFEWNRDRVLVGLTANKLRTIAKKHMRNDRLDLPLCLINTKAAV